MRGTPTFDTRLKGHKQVLSTQSRRPQPCCGVSLRGKCRSGVARQPTAHTTELAERLCYTRSQLALCLHATASERALSLSSKVWTEMHATFHLQANPSHLAAF